MNDTEERNNAERDQTAREQLERIRKRKAQVLAELRDSRGKITTERQL